MKNTGHTTHHEKQKKAKKDTGHTHNKDTTHKIITINTHTQQQDNTQQSNQHKQNTTDENK